MISYSDFEKIELRAGTILEAKVFEKARKPAYQLRIDFGDFGIKKSSAQITVKYPNPAALEGKQIVAVTNFPPKQIANFMSECLVLGVVGDENAVTLLTTDKPTPNGLLIS
ncbi:tRNA-binding protein [Bernardetia sp.]|uniref:tRNA-binding protein n=1 Tax=Bernardetia sp. TaxID=1937974 RepID=UPI0025B8295E|nr:tRNA-binding protein [Bernardetia sp.]